MLAIVWARWFPLGANNPNANNGLFYFNGNNDASNSNNNYAARLDPCFINHHQGELNLSERKTIARYGIGLVT